MSTLRSTVSACPFSSNAITTTPAPYARTRRACSRNGSSPSFSESELTTPFPWTHLSPASSTDQRELSTMIGIRATSGSVATRLRKVVIARSPSSRSASMFTSRRLAPPRTCSSATSVAAWKSPASTSRRKLAERVRQPGVRMARDPGRRDLGEVLDERPHLGGAERAVDAHYERLRVLDRDPERLDRLAREVAAALVHGGEREPERQLRRRVLRGDDRGLRVQRVEDGFDQKEVDAALAQRADLLGVRLDHLVEGRGAVGGIVHPRRERERHVERPDRAGHEPAELVGDLPRELRPFE